MCIRDRSYTTTQTEEHPEGIHLTSTLAWFMETYEIDFDLILGGKTGSTKEAGLCLASLLSLDGKEFICVTLHAPETEDGQPQHIDVYKRQRISLGTGNKQTSQLAMILETTRCPNTSAKLGISRLVVMIDGSC